MRGSLRWLLPLVLAPLACTSDGEPADTDDTTINGSTSGTPSSEGSTSGSTAAEASTTGEPTSTTDGADESSGGVPAGTPGCGLEVPTGASTVQIQVGPDTREYLLVIPDGYDPNTPLPLVFGFHGRGSTAEISRLYFDVEQSSGDQAIFVYPQGLPIESMGGQSGWDLAATGIDVALFDAIVEQLSEGACIDSSRIFSTGHSFGGYMSNALGCFRADVLRAIAPVAGGPPFGACQAQTVAAWLAHGTLDEVVPLSQGELARDALLDRNGCTETSAPTEPTPCVSYDGCSEGLPVVWCAHDEPDLQGHMWPSFGGPAIWEFFETLPPKG